MQNLTVLSISTELLKTSIFDNLAVLIGGSLHLAENAGYGFDKIETNWEQYNHTAPEYDISFDATILKFYTQKEEAGVKTSGKLRRSFRKHLKATPLIRG